MVTSDLTVDGHTMSIQPLLKLMDLCTCACAEKHTKVNCVTVAMGDLVFEQFPQVGDILELVAHPVLTGRTSLDIVLTVTLERGRNNNTNDENEDDDNNFNGGKHIVCEASFVYVTTRGPKGEKRLVPPLPTNGHFDNERFEWETIIAENKRNLLKIEKTATSSLRHMENEDDDENDSDDSLPPYDLESREVVLPFAQNHMVSVH